MVKDIIMEKKQKNITPKSLERLALNYLSRYDSSAFRLERYLLSKIEKERQKGFEISAVVNIWISEIIRELKQKGYLDDKRYAENKLYYLRRQHRSTRYIRLKLIEEGISEEIISSLDISLSDDEEAAFQWAKKHLLGKDPIKYSKEMARMSRAGFSYKDSKRALELCREED